MTQTRRLPQTVGEVQRKLEAAQEHMGHVWGLLDRAGMAPHRRMYTPNTTEGMRPGTVEYHFAAVEQYVIESLWGMYEFVGRTDGQLCPNDDCCYDLAFDKAGWWKCPNCDQPFYAVDSDSDTEDYHNHKPGERTPPMPDKIPYARSLGPSWGTPKGKGE